MQKIEKLMITPSRGCHCFIYKIMGAGEELNGLFNYKTSDFLSELS